MFSRSHTTLPLEIQFLILDHVRSIHGQIDRRELKRLGLICAAWSEHVRSILFKRVEVNDNSMATRFLSLVQRNGRLGQYTTTLFIQSLDIFNSPVLHTFLPNLRAITICGCLFGRLETSACPWPTVTRLCIKFCVLSSPADLWDVISLFPALDHLKFSGWMIPSEPHPASIRAADAHLKHLSVVSWSKNDASTQAVALQLAAHNLTVDRLSLTLDGNADCDASPFNVLLQKITALQHLDIVELPQDQTPVIGICIKSCTALLSLTITLRFSTADPVNMQLGLISLLRSISSPVLTRLTLRVSLLAPVFQLPWEEVDTVLCTGSLDYYSSLECVVIQVADGVDNTRFSDFAAFARARMAGVERRRLLRFEICAV
ncbi:hypothetical protein R3P38DRAFT_3308330 [Favolaschia claudopus]|uniref:F-box domain-containing protein n=1 Tax=Favolaschia claudopus TaxID=2862362 RepID=A0AAW0CYC9_9AGAR